MEQINEILSSNLIKLRKYFKYTQAELAEKLQYSDKTISKWETGEIIPSLENLIKICELYDVTLDEITKPLPDEMFSGVHKYNYQIQNEIIITTLAIVAVWLIMTIIFVYSQIINGINNWIVFVWALPISCLTALYFNKIWGKRKFVFIILSIFLWSLITSIFLQFLKYNLFPIYFIGIPLQAAIILWSNLKLSPRQKHSKK